MLGIPPKTTGFPPEEAVRVADYAKDVLVETQWVQDHLDDDSIRVVEVDENPALYADARNAALART